MQKSTPTKLLTCMLIMLSGAFSSDIQAQITVTLGSGKRISQTNPSTPSPYNYAVPSRTMQFVYTASEIFSAGGAPGEFTALAWKVDDVCSGDLFNYTIRMKSTSAKDVSSYDYNNLKTVKYAHPLKSSSSGWLTISFDSIFNWDGNSNILIDVCFSKLSSTTATGSVYLYDSSNNMTIGDFNMKGSACGSTSGSSTTYKPFVQFTINPICYTPKGLKAQSSTATVQISWQAVQPTPDIGYECAISEKNSPPAKGTITTGTSVQPKGLCPSKVYYAFVRTLCDSTSTSDWSKPVVFKTNSNTEAKANSPLCEGRDLKFTIGEGLAYEWNGPSGFSSSLREPSIQNVQRKHQGNYSVLLTDSNSCQTLYWVPIQVDTLPVMLLKTPSWVCEGSTLTLDADGVDSIVWTGPGSFYSTLKTTEFEASLTDEGVYSAIGFNSYGCSNSDSSSVDVVARPDLGISANSPLCEGSTLELNSNTLLNPVWTFPSKHTSNANRVVVENISTKLSGWYHFRAEDKYCANADSIYVEVKNAPQLEYTGKTEVCAGDDLLLMATGASTLSWSNDNGPLGSGNLFNLSDVQVADVVGLKLTGTGENGCEKTMAVGIEVHPLPEVIIKPVGDVCEGDDFVLEAGMGEGGSYLWTGPNGFTNSARMVNIRSADQNDRGTYRLTFTNEYGCTQQNEVQVDVHKLPVVTLQNEASKLWATGGYILYTWFKDGVEISGEYGSTYWATTLGSYHVVVTDEFGCTNASKVVEVTVLSVQGHRGPLLSISPNPAHGTVSVAMDQAIGMLHISDACGQVIYSLQTDSRHIDLDLSSLRPGFYLISCGSNRKIRNILVVN